LGGLPALNKILPNLPLPGGNLLFGGSGSGNPETATTNIIGSSKLTLNGFTAYLERQGERTEIVKIPPVFDEPLEVSFIECLTLSNVDF
jgi:hypothetical protein